ncbi:MAG: hypothetical protein EA364_11785, partial [Balneolaceae bacterium]
FQDRGLVYIAAGGVLENRDLYRITGDHNISPSGAMGTFINDGILEKINGTTFSTINIIVDSRPESIIRVSDGSLRLSARSMYHNMTFHAAGQNDELTLQSGTHTFRGNISGEPVGRVIINTETEAHSEGATVDFRVSGLHWASSYFRGGGTLTNAGIIRVDANNWAGVNNSTLINNGEMYLDRGIFYLAASARLENHNLVELNGSPGILPSSSMGTFLNNASLIKTGDYEAGVSTLFQSNAGSSIEVTEGTLRFTANSSLTNVSLSVPSEDASLIFQSALHTFSGVFTSAPKGNVEINSSFRAGGSGARFNFSESGLRWTGGRQQQGGSVTNSGLIYIDSNGLVGSSDSRFVNEGSMYMEKGGLNLSQEGIFENRGLIEWKNNGNITSSEPAGTFINDGEFVKSGGGLQSVFSAHFENRPGSMFRHNSGEIRFTRSLTHQRDAVISGTGRMDIATAEYLNYGIYRPGTKDEPLVVIGDYTASDSAAVFTVTLDSTSSTRSTGYLNVTETTYNVNFNRVGGRAILGGRLILNLDEEFIPVTGDEYEIITTLKGINGGFHSTQGLVNEELGMSFYPSIVNNRLILSAVEGIPVLTPPITLNPDELTAGGVRTIVISGSGFGPDLFAELQCSGCEDPENQSLILGMISSLSPTQAEIRFDLSTGKISGDYILQLKDTRNGSISTPIFINEGPLYLAASVLKSGNGDDRDPGLFSIRANRVLTTPLVVPVTFGGSGQKFVHYMTDNLGDAVTIPAGSDSVVVGVFPINMGGAFSRTVSMLVEFQQPPASDGFTPPSLFASMNITGGTNNQPFRVFNSLPRRGGNGGVVTLQIAGMGMSASTTVSMSGGSSGVQLPFDTEVNETGTLVKASFVMSGQQTGLRDIIVKNGSAEVFLAGAFQIETAVYPHVNLQILAPPRVPRTRFRTYTIVLKNMGNVDVTGYAVLSGLPENIEWTMPGYDVVLPGGSKVNWSEIAPVMKRENYIVFETPSINLRAGESRRIEINAAILDPQIINLVAAWIYR